jgi:hypothetical protein
MATITIERTVEPQTTKPGFRRRRQIAVAAALIIVAAVVIVVTTDQPDPVLVSNGAGQISRLDPISGETSFTVSNAVKAPDGSGIYRAEAVGDTTVLEVLDPDSGNVLATTEVTGQLEIRAVSPFGGAVALMAQGTGDLYAPEPREYTSINVVWDDGRQTENYYLKGNFEPETFSTDEKSLFLLEFFPADAPDRYYVRQLDLETGVITAVTTPDQQLGIELNPEMRGHARAQAMAPDGSHLFSLYTIGSDEAPVHDPADPHTDRWAFVHTLNLVEKWSHCIFLPVPFGTGKESAMSLGISGDGEHLFVVDASTEHVARIDANDLDIQAVQKIPGLFGETPRPVAVGPEVVYLGLYDTVVEMGRDSLIPNAAFMITQSGAGALSINSLELAPDGSTLRVAHGHSISVLEMPEGRIIATITSPGKTEQSFVGDPVGERTEIGLEWVIPSE